MKKSLLSRNISLRMATKKLNRFEPRGREVKQSTVFCMYDSVSETDHQAV